MEMPGALSFSEFTLASSTIFHNNYHKIPTLVAQILIFKLENKYDYSLFLILHKRVSNYRHSKFNLDILI